MRILKHGTPQKDIIKIFSCHICGCEFEANQKEYESVAQLPEDRGAISVSDFRYLRTVYYCRCPECGEKVEEKN